MADVVRTAPVTLRCLSAVHIGSGDRLGPLDFVREGRMVTVIDQSRLQARLAEVPTLADRYVRLCESDRPDLGEFLRVSGLPAADLAAYRVVAGGALAREILPFLKLPSGDPYIPGSSLKGSVRSALLHRLVGQEQRLREEAVRAATEDIDDLARRNRLPSGRRTVALRGASRRLDELAFGKDHNHDAMRLFQFADSGGPPASHLVAAEVRVLSVHGGRLEVKETRPGNPMRLVAEILPTGTALGSRLAWNAHLEGSDGPAKSLGFGPRLPFLADWIANCNAIARDALRREAEFYQAYGMGALAQWHEERLKELETLPPSQCMLHLGWGAGFDAMAVTNLLESAAVRQIRQGANLGKLGSAGPVEPFPKSRKVIWRDDRPVEPLGWILLTVGARPKPIGQVRAAVPAPGDVPTAPRGFSQRPRPPVTLPPRPEGRSVEDHAPQGPQAPPVPQRNPHVVEAETLIRTLKLQEVKSQLQAVAAAIGRCPAEEQDRLVGLFRARQEEMTLKPKEITANMESLAKRLQAAPRGEG